MRDRVFPWAEVHVSGAVLHLLVIRVRGVSEVPEALERGVWVQFVRVRVSPVFPRSAGEGAVVDPSCVPIRVADRES